MRLVSPLLFLGALACALWFAPAPASAQYFTMREYERLLDHKRVALTADLNTFAGRIEGARYAFVQPTVLAAARYREAVFEAALPFAYLHQETGSDDAQNRVLIGNPYLGLSYLPDCSCGLSRVTVGMAFDAAQSDTPLEQRALSLGRGALGDWDGYLWRDHMLPLVIGASSRMQLGMVRLSWDGDLIFGLPARTREFNFGTQHAGELAVVFNWHMQLAGRLSLAYYPTLPGDNLQSALTFYLRYVIVTNAVGARFVMNLDPPLGFSFNEDGVWSAGAFFSTQF